MIKTYDEALKTLNDIRTYLAISRADDCVEELDKIARYFINEKHSQPTLLECIKEWESRGYIVNNQFKDYQYYTISSGYFDMEDIFIYISLNSVNEFYYSLEGHLNIELSELLNKTLKALKVEDE